MKKLLALILSAILIMLSLTSCGKPDMPMQVEVDGFTIVLGKTCIQELVDLGYKLNTTGRNPDVVKNGVKHLPYSYSLSKGAGQQFWVTVYIPWGGKKDVSKEKKLSQTEGIVFNVSATPSSVAKIDFIYNGIDVKDLSLDYAMDEWNCTKNKPDDDNSRIYSVQIKKGVVQVEGKKDKFEKITIQMSYNEFKKLQ